MPTSDAQIILNWYEALPDTPNQARDTDLQAAHWFLDHEVRLKEVLGALLLGSVRRLRRDPALPPLQPIASLSYFAPIVREVLSEEDGLDPGFMTFLYEAVFGVPPEEHSWSKPPKAPGGR